MSQLKLSIIVPVYNVEQYVGQCLQSLYSPSVDESLYEVIVVNDGTRDNSMAVVEPIAKAHPNMCIINQENGGLSRARNTGLDAAQGEYVWFIDSDDWLTPDAIERVYGYLDTNPGIDMVTTPLYWRFDDSSKDKIDINVDEDTKILGLDFIKTIGETGAIQRNVIRRAILDRADIRFYPGILHEDGLFGPQTFYQAESVLVVKEPFYNYRQRADGSIMHSVKIKSAYDIIIVHQQLMIYLDKYVKPQDKKWFRQKYISLFLTAINFTWHLRNTPEFKQFLHDSRPYRIKESLKCLSCGKKGIVKCFVYGIFPYEYTRLRDK